MKVRSQDGFSLVEILVAMAIFAMIVIGAMTVLGATSGGGILEGFPNAFLTARAAKDNTAASVYVQAFQEFVASKGSANGTPGTYCVGTGCNPEVPLPSGLSGYPTPSSTPYQLNWTKLDVLIETWYWDPATSKFVTTNTGKETLTRVRTMLTWQLRGATRSLAVDRFIP